MICVNIEAVGVCLAEKWPPRHVYILIPGTCERARLLGKGELKLLTGRPDNREMTVDCGPNVTNKGAYKWKRGQKSIRGE